MNHLKSPYFENQFKDLEQEIVPKSNIYLQGKTPFASNNWSAEISDEQEFEEAYFSEEEAFEDYSGHEFMDEVDEVDEVEDGDASDDEELDYEILEMEYADYENEGHHECSCNEHETQDDSWNQANYEEFVPEHYDEREFVEEEYEESDYEDEFMDEQLGGSSALSSFVSRIVQNSNQEYANWDNGILVETSPRSHKYLKKYWMEGTRKSAAVAARKIKNRSPWSAAFISYIIKKSGGVPPFKASGGHYVYASEGKRNYESKKIDYPISMWLYPVSAIKPRIGDLLFNARVDSKRPYRNGANFNNIDNGTGWATHSDLIIDMDGNSITVIGGNTSHRVKGVKIKDTVAKKKLRLDGDGMVILKGDRHREYFGILRFFDPKAQAATTKAGLGNHLIDNLKNIGLTLLDYGKLSFSLFSALSTGLSENKITDLIFHHKNPSLVGRKLSKGNPLITEWLNIRSRFVRPLIRSFSENRQNHQGGSTGSIATPVHPNNAITGRAGNLTIGNSIPRDLGKLVIDTSVPELRKSLPEYQFTEDDALWMARFVKGESGVKNDANGHAVLWAMFNRFGMLRHRVKGWTSFYRFLQLYSTTLQPILRSKGAAQRVWKNHGLNPKKYPIKEGVGKYEGTNIKRVQYQKHIDLQKMQWHEIPFSIREMVINILQGKIANPGIGIASDFASTKIYYKQRYGHFPKTTAAWKQYTLNYAKNRCKRKIKGCTWIGDRQNLNQMKNAFFIDNRFKNVPHHAVQIVR